MHINNTLPEMATISGLVGELAQSFNGPLAQVQEAIALVRELISELDVRSDPAREAGDPSGPLSDTLSLLDDAMLGVKQMSESLGSLKKFGRLEQMEPLDFPAEESIDLTWLLSRHLFGHHVRLVTDYGQTPHVRSSPALLNHALLGIFAGCAAALSALFARGTVTVRTSTQRQGSVCIEVIDDRPVAPDPADSCIARSQQLVRDLGGELELHAHPGGGAVCKVWLPTSDACQGANC